jgi:hypothetical protein
MTRRRPHARGYVLAEALISAAIASLAGVLAVTLLIWSAEAIDRSQSSVGAMRALGRLEEDSRLLTPDDLNRPASGALGRYQWIRSPGRALGSDLPYAPVPVRFFIEWTSGGRQERREVQAIVRPGAKDPGP